MKNKLKKNSHEAIIEHVNLSANDPDKLAEQLCQLFDWQVRWSGASMDDGYTVHVGGSNSYLAIYKNNELVENRQRGHSTIHNLNHIGVVVDDLKILRQRAAELGLSPNSDSDYGPCKSFYCNLIDGLELEVIAYS